MQARSIYYAIRLLNFTIFSTNTSITGIAATFQNDLRETVMWNVGTGNAYTHQSNITLSNGSVRIGAIRIPIEDPIASGECAIVCNYTEDHELQYGNTL